MNFNIPNILTIVRLILVPCMGVCMYKDLYIPAAVMFFIAGVTDVVDGYIARKFNQITYFGKIMDPLADKLLSATALVMLAVSGRIHETNAFLNWIIPAFVLSKEALMGIGGLIIVKSKHKIRSSNWYGKAATVVFFIAILLLMFDVTVKIGRIALILAVLCSVFALAMYIGVFFSIQKAPPAKKNESE